MSSPISTRLPGVPLLQLNATGSEYSRWRRGVQYALQSKGLWKYCNGEAPMPMPAARPSSKLPQQMAGLTSTPQPSLFEERKTWVRRDRDAKLDIYLSLSEDTMLELFDVGPPLPPSSLSAQEILEALDERFTAYKFEAYHHAFCHFLNLHIDQFATIAEFNAEYLTTLEDLIDYGHPLSNTQACSAYFSKLRCTQNPWVVKMLQEWDLKASEPQLVDLLEESPLWAPIRPLSLSTPSKSYADSLPDETSDRSLARSSTKATTDSTYATTFSSRPSYSSKMSIRTAESQGIPTHDSRTDVEPADETVSSMLLDLAEHAEKTTPQRIDTRNSSSTAKSMLERPLPDRQAILNIPLPVRARSASPRFPGVTYNMPSPSRSPLAINPPIMFQESPDPVQNKPQTPSSPNPPLSNPNNRTPTQPLPPTPPPTTTKPPNLLYSPTIMSRSNPNLTRPTSSANSSVISLPIQGIQSTSWDYLPHTTTATTTTTAAPQSPLRTPNPPPKSPRAVYASSTAQKGFSLSPTPDHNPASQYPNAMPWSPMMQFSPRDTTAFTSTATPTTTPRTDNGVHWGAQWRGDANYNGVTAFGHGSHGDGDGNGNGNGNGDSHGANAREEELHGKSGDKKRGVAMGARSQKKVWGVSVNLARFNQLGKGVKPF